jgi:glutamate/tyrosine decarboxylase-like PLP-dependent enzyme
MLQRDPHEETLDPSDWAPLRALAHRMVDDMLDYTEALHEQPAWQHMPQRAKAQLRQPLPLEPQSTEAVYEEFLKYVLPYAVGNVHPRFWGWVIGTGTAYGALAEFLAAIMNTNTGGLDHHSAVHVERQVIDWLKEMLGYPHAASGLLTSGCSAANLIGLAVARNVKATFDLRQEGMRGAPQTMILYASQEAHSSVQKAVELLGLGSDALHLVAVDDDFRIDLDALRTAIAHDRQAGRFPFCIVGAAGTTNTGAIDDLEALAEICTEENLWLHVDGAFGAWAALSPTARHLVAGMEHADSLAFDLHKWMYMPYEIGCVLVQNEPAHREAFSLTPAYLAHGEGGAGLTGGDLPWFSDYGFQLSRGFRALKAWMSIKEHGARRYGQLIQQNIDQAHYLAELVEAAPELELVAPVPLNVVCFRYVDGHPDQGTVNELNKRIVVALQESGVAVPSGTVVGGRYALHVANVNHRSRWGDFELLVHEVIRLGKELARTTRGAPRPSGV